MDEILTQEKSCANHLLANRWPGYRVCGYEEKGSVLHIELKPLENYAVCPHCGQRCYKRHASQRRTAMDYPLFGQKHTVVHFNAQRYRCSCGHTCTIQPTWIERRSRVTNALIYNVQLLLRESALTIKSIGELTGLSWPTIRKIDKMQLEYFFDKMELKGVRNLAIDEFSIEKGHKYATVIIDNDRSKVLWVGKGKTISAVKPFFEELQTRGFAQQIQSVACDMNAAYPKLVTTYLPKATIVYDLFHVLYNFRRDVLAEAKKICQVRLEENLTNEGKSACRSLSGIDWLMVMRKEDIENNRKDMLETAMKDNELLAAIYPVAESVRELWRIKDSQTAETMLKGLARISRQIARKYRFEPMAKFARMLKRRREGIIMAGHYGFATNKLEGINNKIKVIKRTAFGYRDFKYFCLKIKSSLPGKGFVSPYAEYADYAVINKTLWLGVWKKCCYHA